MIFPSVDEIDEFAFFRDGPAFSESADGKKMVSVRIITYNQENYIAQAVRSALDQIVDFEYEIVIGDDCSTDKTREIIADLQRAHPDKIRLLMRDKKGGGIPAQLNFMETQRACVGKYIATLDGDDYWTDPHKLRKQVDFLESHPDFAICFHNVVIFHQDGSREPHNFRQPDKPATSSLVELLAGNNIPTCSVMSRRGLYAKWPKWFFAVEAGDWAINVLNARCGKVGYLNEVMGACRVHAQGYWTSRPHEARLNDAIRMLGYFRADFGPEYAKVIRNAQCKYYDDLIRLYAASGDLPQLRVAIFRRMATALRNHHLPTLSQLKMTLELHLPVLYRLRTRE